MDYFREGTKKHFKYDFLMTIYTICVCFSLSDAFSKKKLFPKIAFQTAIFGTVLNLQNEKNGL